MKKILLITATLLFISCNKQYQSSSIEPTSQTTYDYTENPSYENTETNSQEEISTSNPSTTSINENYNKIKIYLNPSVQIHNLYYDKITTEAETMNIVAQKIYNELSNDNRFIIYINDRMLSLTNSVKESNSYNVDYHLALHTNAGGGSGSEAFYYSNNYFANIVLSHFAKTHSFPNRGVKKTTNLYELKNSTAKHKTLIEFLFHDNEIESQYIKNNYDQLASSICNAFYDIANQ